MWLLLWFVLMMKMLNGCNTHTSLFFSESAERMSRQNNSVGPLDECKNTHQERNIVINIRNPLPGNVITVNILPEDSHVCTCQQVPQVPESLRPHGPDSEFNAENYLLMTPERPEEEPWMLPQYLPERRGSHSRSPSPRRRRSPNDDLRLSDSEQEYEDWLENRWDSLYEYYD